MEILNNIWNALTTENKVLMNFMSIPFTFFEIYLSFLLFSTILKINCSKCKKTIYISSLSLLSLINLNLLPQPINNIVNYIFTFAIILILFRLPIYKAFIALLLPFGIFSIIGVFILNPLTKFLNIDPSLLNSIPIYKLCYIVILYTLILIIIYLLKNKLYNIKLFMSPFKKKYKNIILLNILLGISVLIIQLIVNAFYLKILPIYVTSLSSLSLILYFLISLYSLYHIIKLQETTKSLENAETYNKTLSVLYDNVKAFKHDFENMVNMIGGYVKNNDIDGLREYYSGLEKDYAKIKNLSALNPTLINNSGIYNLLIKKYNKANSIGVKMDLEYFFDFERLHMPIYQFSRMLGILIDNAIEAAESSEEKHVLIRFRDSSFHHTQIIIVENSYCSKEKIDTKNIFKKGITGKDGHMGMGLWEVHEILMKNNNVNLITSTDENIFKQQIEIYY